MDLLLPIFQLLYFVAHFLVSLALSVCDTFRDLHHLLLRLCSFFRPLGVSSYRLQADAAMLKKIPEHVGIVIIGHHGNNILQIVTVINWCIGYGVKYLSLYDAHGILKQNKSGILKELENRNLSAKFNVSTHNTDCHQIKESISSNGFNDEDESLLPMVTINLLSLEDGKGNLVSVARSLCGGAKRLDQSMVDTHVLTHEQPDPEVVITVGEPMTTLGFLPWQIRLTEFFEVSSLNRFEYNDFRTILGRYSRCEQRCGK